ncbi:MAG: hypothetical protein ACTSQB_05600, partial [Candidatus Heimdallarchaeota archaeon]
MNDQHYLDIPQEFREQLIPVREEQLKLAKTLDLDYKLSLGNIRLVAGLDVAFTKDDSLACAGITVVDFRTFEIVEEA